MIFFKYYIDDDYSSHVDDDYVLNNIKKDMIFLKDDLKVKRINKIIKILKGITQIGFVVTTYIFTSNILRLFISIDNILFAFSNYLILLVLYLISCLLKRKLKGKKG